MSCSLRRWLESAELQHHYQALRSLGINEHNFCSRVGAQASSNQNQFFQALGVDDPDEQKQFLQLVQIVKQTPIQQIDDTMSRRGPTAAGDDIRSILGSTARGDAKSKIRVCVRKRPISRREISRKEKDVVQCQNQNDAVFVLEPKQKVDLTKYIENHAFVFDQVYGEEMTNQEIYHDCVRPLVRTVFNKGKATCFAYGQTGSGKTFTMLGPEGGRRSETTPGMYALAAKDIFAVLRDSPDYQMLEVHVSFFEIYGGKLFDLLHARAKLIPREDSKQKVVVQGLKTYHAPNSDVLMQVIEHGNKLRSSGSTGANDSSSRSHAILQIQLINNQTNKQHGRFSFIDLAGSERGADTSSNNRKTRMEGAEINKSLLALKECIRALDLKAGHLPFRGSKLTQVLKDSFVGANSRTVMFANVSPNSGSVEHTLNTLRYADRVKELKKSKKAPTSYNAYMPHQGHKGKISYPDQQKAPSRAQKPPRNLAPQAYQQDDDDDDDEHLPQEVVEETGHEVPLSAEERAKSEMMATHANIVDSIYQTEDEIVKSHRRQIDTSMRLVKEDMELLKNFDKDDMDVDRYVEQLEDVLARKVKNIASLQDRLKAFKHQLVQEAELSNSLKRFQLR